MESYMLGQLVGYALICYVFYWVIKKVWARKINRNLLMHERIVSAILSIIILVVITGVRLVSQ